MAVNQKFFGLRINQFFIIISGLLIIISAILIYYFILRGVYGRFDTSELIPNSNAIEDFLLKSLKSESFIRNTQKTPYRQAAHG